jgi:hypothetical protein
MEWHGILHIRAGFGVNAPGENLPAKSAAAVLVKNMVQLARILRGNIFGGHDMDISYSGLSTASKFFNSWKRNSQQP